MSYLDVPRLHFFGSFTADPSTVNNIPFNYHLPPEYDTLNSGGQQNWNPFGTHDWTIQNCTVQTVVGPDGSLLQDPLIGTSVASSATPPSPPFCAYRPGPNPQASNPKIVDLDPQQQSVSMIFGLQIQIGDSSSGTVTGCFQPQPLMDLFNQGQSAYYQSVLQDLQWSSDLPSPVLQELQRISPEALSIKFVLLINSPEYLPGRAMPGGITGTIGPLAPGEPPNFVLGRLMRPLMPPLDRGHQRQVSAQQGISCNFTPFIVNNARGKVIVDFGNSFPMGFSRPGVPRPDSALAPSLPLQVAIIPSQGFTPNRISLSPSQILGTVEYTEVAYRTKAMIQEFDVSAEQMALLQSSILGVFAGDSKLLLENPNATLLAVTPMVCRLDPGDQVSIDLVALAFGRPAVGQAITIEWDNASLREQQEIQQKTVPGAPLPPFGTPPTALQWTDANGQLVTSLTTDTNGRASFVLHAATEGPGKPRSMVDGKATYLDGQVYGIGFKWALATNEDPSLCVSIHAYDLVAMPETPEWEADVLPILLPYSKLYPFMRNFFDPSSEKGVLGFAEYISCRMGLPITDPRYMPVTRDLSANKKQIVLRWLARQLQGGKREAT